MEEGLRPTIAPVRMGVAQGVEPLVNVYYAGIHH